MGGTSRKSQRMKPSLSASAALGRPFIIPEIYDQMMIESATSRARALALGSFAFRDFVGINLSEKKQTAHIPFKNMKEKARKWRLRFLSVRNES